MGLVHPVSSNQTKPYVIKRDMGGKAQTYVNRWSNLSREGRKIVIDGPCYSACTLVLHNQFKLDVCVTDRAKLGFHQPFRTDRFGFVRRDAKELELIDEVWTYMLSGLPIGLRKIAAKAPDPKRGARKTKMLVVSSPELQKFVKPCK